MLRSLACHGAEQPVTPSCGLAVKSSIHESPEREGCIAQPTVAIVPVPLAADFLGQRSGWSSNNPAGWRIRQCFQNDQRAFHCVLCWPLIRALADPIPPEVLRLS